MLEEKAVPIPPVLLKKTFQATGKVDKKLQFFVSSEEWLTNNLINNLKQFPLYSYFIGPSQSGKTTKMFELMELVRPFLYPIYVNLSEKSSDISIMTFLENQISKYLLNKCIKSVDNNSVDERISLYDLLSYKRYYNNQNLLLIIDEYAEIHNYTDSYKFFSLIRSLKQENIACNQIHALHSFIAVSNTPIENDVIYRKIVSMNNNLIFPNVVALQHIYAPYFEKEDLMKLIYQFEIEYEINVNDKELIVNEIITLCKGAQGISILLLSSFHNLLEKKEEISYFNWKNIIYSDDFFFVVKNTANFQSILKVTIDLNLSINEMMNAETMLRGKTIAFLQIANILKQNCNLANPFLEIFFNWFYFYNLKIIKPIKIQIKKDNKIDFPMLFALVIPIMPKFTLILSKRRNNKNSNVSQQGINDDDASVMDYIDSFTIGLCKGLNERVFHTEPQRSSMNNGNGNRLNKRYKIMDEEIAVEYNGDNFVDNNENVNNNKVTFRYHLQREDKMYRHDSSLSASQTWLVNFRLSKSVVAVENNQFLSTSSATIGQLNITHNSFFTEWTLEWKYPNDNQIHSYNINTDCNLADVLNNNTPSTTLKTPPTKKVKLENDTSSNDSSNNSQVYAFNLKVTLDELVKLGFEIDEQLIECVKKSNGNVNEAIVLYYSNKK